MHGVSILSVEVIKRPLTSTSLSLSIVLKRDHANPLLNCEAKPVPPQSSYESRKYNMMEMAQSTLNRIWNRLANRYRQDEKSDCCGGAIEDVQSDSTETESESFCK